MSYTPTPLSSSDPTFTPAAAGEEDGRAGLADAPRIGLEELLEDLSLSDGVRGEEGMAVD